MAKVITLNNGMSVYDTEILAKVAAYIYCASATSTDAYDWIIDFADIEEHFDLPTGFINNTMAEQIKKVLCKEFENQISECNVFGNRGKNEEIRGCFKVDVYTDFVPNWTEDDSI